MTEAVLRVEGLSKSFPGVRALDNVSIDLRSHEVLGLIGENGAGKSTLLKLIAGHYRADSGAVIVRGSAVPSGSIAAATDAGIGMVFQEQSLLTNLTVAENILLGNEDGATRFGFYNWPRLRKLAEVQLSKLGTDIRATASTGSLSFAERQLVEFAKVLSIEERTHHEPVVLLDEPTSVLEGSELDKVLAQIERLRARASVIFVSHRLDEVLRISDRVYVMTNGQCVAERDPKNSSVSELQELMLGRTLTSAYQRSDASKKATTADEPRLIVKDLTKHGVCESVSFEVRKGEVLGIAGVEGSGREELCRTLFGAHDVDSGAVTLDGQRVNFASVTDAVNAGIGYVPSERRVEGIVGGLNVRENMTLAHLREVLRGPVISARNERSLARRWIERLRIKTPSTETQAANLSGGNQQKVVLTKWLIARGLKVLILDHPMRGLDVGAKAEIFALIRELAGQGISVVFIADTIDELIALSDSIIVMRDGRITSRFTDSMPSCLKILEKMV